MNRQKPQPPWEFLLTASRNSLQSYEPTRLAHASNLRKEITILMDQWLEEHSAATVARWLIEQRDAPGHATEASVPAESKSNGHGASDNFFPDSVLNQPSNREVA